MAYAITARHWMGDKEYIEAVLDSADDLEALGDGYAPDSRAIVAEGGAAYMTDASGQWQELGSPGGGGSSITVEALTVTANGTTTAPSGKAYNPVTTNVPNSYGASDEGKVVSNGALVAQTAHAPVTENGTVDTTLYNSVPINVPNPNAVETISGTLGNPWGNEFSRLLPLLRSPNDATVTMVVNAGGRLTRRVYAYTESDLTEYIASAALGGSDFDVWEWAVYNDAGTYLANGSSQETGSGRFTTETLSESAVTTLTIIHHPMTGSLTPAENQTFGGNV